MRRLGLLAALLLLSAPEAFGAWGSVGSIGSGGDDTAGTSIALTTSAAAESGNVVIVVVSSDNASTTDGNNSTHTSITDSAGGNTWTKVNEYENSNAAADAGATVSLWYSIITNTIASSGTITANFTFSPPKSGITAWEFTIGAGSTISEAAETQGGTDASDFQSLNVTPTNTEHLWVRGISLEGAVTDSFTKTAAYDNAFVKGGTSGGAGIVNNNAAGEFDIFTGTSNASLPTPNGGSRDQASVLVALLETPGAGASILPRRVYVSD